MILKLKWLPWLFIVAGILELLSDEVNPFVPILLILIGAAGVYFFYGGKKSGASPSANRSPTVPTRAAIQPAPPKPVTVTPSNACPNCGAVLEDGMIFCSKCGTKVR